MSRKGQFGGVIFSLIGIIMLLGGIADWRRHQNFVRLSNETEGEIIGYESQERKDTETNQTYYLKIPIVRYEVDGRRTLEDRSLPREPLDFPIGSKLKLRYLSSEPEQVEYLDSYSYALVPYLMGIVGLLFFGAGIFVFRRV